MDPLRPAILLIEKDGVTLEIYQRELCNYFTVFAFTELTGVLETLARQDIQAIAIEPEICAGQGWELIAAIQEKYAGRYVPIIICSTRDATRKNSQLNIARYLTKPVLPRTLREIILEVVRSKNLPGKNK